MSNGHGNNKWPWEFLGPVIPVERERTSHPSCMDYTEGDRAKPPTMVGHGRPGYPLVPLGTGGYPVGTTTVGAPWVLGTSSGP